jgi:hypothetical protein
LLKAQPISRAIANRFLSPAAGSRRLTTWYKLNRVLRLGNQNAGRCCYARPQHTSKPPGAIMDPRLFEDLLRGEAYLPPRVTAVVAETVKFSVKELTEIDVWARRNKIKSRSEAIRRLVEHAIKRS